jgi:hypothetical protein
MFGLLSGRYVPVALPDDDSKKTRKLAKKLSCSRCGKEWGQGGLTRFLCA